MNGIEANKHAWGQIAQDHYFAFKQSLLSGRHRFNPYIQDELGDLSGKRIIHLQCNTGADTLLLAKMGASAVGVDLVPDNILYARRLAEDLGVKNARFIESDIMALMGRHDEQYDFAFVSEGAICWLPDLTVWGQTIRHLLREGGQFYIFDSHPFFMMLDEHKLPGNVTEIKYPYFGKEPDIDPWIGGYACEPRGGVQAYSWMHTLGDIVTALTAAGLHIDYLHEFQENFFDSGGMASLGNGLYSFDFNKGRFPMSFSLRATAL